MDLSRRILMRFMIASSIALSLPLAAIADGPGKPGGPPGLAGRSGPGDARGGPPCTGESGDLVPPFLHGIVLSEAQRDKIFGILYAQTPSLRDKEKELRKTAIALRELALSAQYDEAKARPLAEANAKASADIALLRARSTSAIYQLLTPEQRKTLEERKATMERPEGDEGAHRPRPPG